MAWRKSWVQVPSSPLPRSAPPAGRLGPPHRDPGQPAGQLTLGELADVHQHESDREPLDERAVEEVDDETAALVHVVAARDAGAVVRVVGSADGVDDVTAGAQHSTEIADQPL